MGNVTERCCAWMQQHCREELFRTLRQRTIQLHGSCNGVYEHRMVPEASHRPFFVTRQVALWLEQQLDFAHWTKAEIETMPTTHVSRWAQANGVDAEKLIEMLMEAVPADKHYTKPEPAKSA